MNSMAGALKNSDDERHGVEVWFFRVTAGWWVFMGLVVLFAALDETKLEHERLLKQPDLVFGFSNKNSLLLAAGFHIVFAPLLLVFRDSITKILLLVWSCSVCGIYCLGCHWLVPVWRQAGDSCAIIRLTADKLGVGSKPFGVFWGLILGGMVLGALLVFLIERRRLKQMAEDAMIEQWRQSHKDKGQFPWAG